MVAPNNQGFSYKKWSFWGGDWGYHHLRKPLYGTTRFPPFPTLHGSRVRSLESDPVAARVREVSSTPEWVSVDGSWNRDSYMTQLKTWGKLDYTLQGINISHLGKRKIIFKMPFLGDMLVPWRVYNPYTPLKTNMEPENDLFFIGISSSRGSFSGSMLVFGGVSDAITLLELFFWAHPVDHDPNL